jgi:hypothetical protein
MVLAAGMAIQRSGRKVAGNQPKGNDFLNANSISNSLLAIGGQASSTAILLQKVYSAE